MGEWRINPHENLQDVLDIAPPGTVIRLPAGVMRQNIVIRTPGITLIGAGQDQTVLAFDRCAKDMDNVGRPLGTFRSFTLAVTAENVTLRALTVRNDAGDPARKGQQVGLSVYGDGFVMEDCSLLSTQDTLFLGPLPLDLRLRYRDLLPEELRRPEPLASRFLNCRIAGSVDFVFGGGSALFENCELRSVHDGRHMGFVAPPPTIFLKPTASFSAAAGSPPIPPFPPGAYTWPGPGGITAWLSLRIAPTALTFTPRASTPGARRTETRPPASARRPRSPAG